MKPAPFEYVRAVSVDDALDVLAEAGGTARVLAGGQSLVPMLNMRLIRPSVLVDVNRLPGLDGIAVVGSSTVVGALTRYTVIEESPLVAERLPLLQTVVRHIGDRQVRNRGTIGGSLCQADPTGEMPLACLVLDATVVALSRRGRRELPLTRFFEGPYTTALADDELLVAVRFPASPAHHAFTEVCRRHNDFAVLSVAAIGSRDDDGRWHSLRIGLGGVNDTPVLATAAAALLEGTTLDDAALAAAAEAVLEDVDPGSDVRASAQYRRHLVPVHVRRALKRLRDAGGEVGG